jgi:hypothetical protein
LWKNEREKGREYKWRHARAIRYKDSLLHVTSTPFLNIIYHNQKLQCIPGVAIKDKDYKGMQELVYI